MPEPESNNLLATLQRHRGGKILAEGSAKLQELVAAVAMTGKPGTLTIKLKVSQASRGNAAVVLTDTVIMKEPKMEAEASFWFATESGELKVWFELVNPHIQVRGGLAGLVDRLAVGCGIEPLMGKMA